MEFKRQTVSLCPVCYAEIPAVVSVSNRGAIMQKKCVEHGESSALVERDPLYYMVAAQQKSPVIYDGYFVDTTERCNLRCDPCYYPLLATDPEGAYSIDRIIQDCRVNAHRAPFILTGGEPTLRDDLPELIERVSAVGPVELLSNGIKLADKDFFDAVMPLITNNDGIATLNLSIHPQSDKWSEVLQRCLNDGLRIESALIVVKDKESFLQAVDQCRELKETVLSFRIKAASNVWHEQRQGERIFVSDMIKWLEETGKPAELYTKNRCTKTGFANVIYDGMFLMLVSWPDVTNVDLIELACPPYYRAKSGEILNMLPAMLINEGLAKGWCKGRRLDALVSSNGNGHLPNHAVRAGVHIADSGLSAERISLPETVGASAAGR